MTTKTKTPTKKFNYLRVPLDDNFNNGLQLILNDNPFFSQADAVKYVLGKYIKQNYSNTKVSKLSNLIKKIGSKTFEKEISESQAQAILKSNGL
jgi:hypothetical protein